MGLQKNQSKRLKIQFNSKKNATQNQVSEKRESQRDTKTNGVSLKCKRRKIEDKRVKTTGNGERVIGCNVCRRSWKSWQEEATTEVQKNKTESY